MTDTDRRDYKNLILMCPKHHKLIDDLEPERFPPETLQKMKDDSLQNIPPWEAWTTQEDLDRVVKLIMMSTEYLVSYGYLQPVDLDPPEQVEPSPGFGATATFSASMGGGPSLDRTVTRGASDESLNYDSATTYDGGTRTATDKIIISDSVHRGADSPIDNPLNSDEPSDEDNV